MEGMRADAIYASAACRTRAWKRREGITGIRYTKASQNGKSKPSGLQVSYRKAREVLEDHFISRGEPYPHNLAVNILREAMSDLQRARLDERKRAQRAALMSTAEQREILERQETA